MQQRKNSLPGGNTSIPQEIIPQENPVFKPAHPHILVDSHDDILVGSNEGLLVGSDDGLLVGSHDGLLVKLGEPEGPEKPQQIDQRGDPEGQESISSRIPRDWLH